VGNAKSEVLVMVSIRVKAFLNVTPSSENLLPPCSGQNMVSVIFSHAVYSSILTIRAAYSFETVAY
jgi:hypothetical protein